MRNEKKNECKRKGKQRIKNIKKREAGMKKEASKKDEKRVKWKVRSQQPPENPSRKSRVKRGRKGQAEGLKRTRD